MKIVTLFIQVVASFVFPAVNPASSNIDRASFYAAMKAENLALVDKQLSFFAKDPNANSRAFEGALLMKKAGLVKNPLKKLKLFKKGHGLLEDALKNDGKNTEFRFLRLMIQEKAPDIVKYKDDIKTDSEMIQADFKNMPEDLRKAVVDYSKNSKVLKPGNFKG